MTFGRSRAAGEKASTSPAQQSRTSTGLEQFCTTLKRADSQSVLDMSGASQANILFITGLGHRITSDDIVGTMEECFGKDFLAGQRSAAQAQRFLDQTLTAPDASFDAILVWDALQFLTGHLLDQVIAHLLRVTRPGGQLLVFFNADDKATTVPVYNYRIQDQKTLLQIPRGGLRQPAQYFQNRTVEKLFEKASSLKFFLTRDSLREVIVRR
jgi:SAM-dependent methyltransferase